MTLSFSEMKAILMKEPRLHHYPVAIRYLSEDGEAISKGLLNVSCNRPGFSASMFSGADICGDCPMIVFNTVPATP